MKYRTACCGGTFDFLHAGHKTFLEFASMQTEKLVIGLTTDEFLKEHKPGVEIQPYVIREQAIRDFFQTINFINFEIVPLSDPYGPAKQDPQFQAIIVTDDTIQNAEKINEIRKTKGLNLLEILVCPFEQTLDGTTISSSHIRSGKISKSGQEFVKQEWFEKKFTLPEDLRSEFQKPFGELITDSEKWIQTQQIDLTKVITVGDATTELFVQNNITPGLSVIDFKVKRHETFQNLSKMGFDETIEVIRISNPAAVITPELFTAISTWFESQKPTVIIINGEDDLAVLPVLLIAPLGFTVFYGQPNEGLVKVEITDENKMRAHELMNQFQTS